MLSVLINSEHCELLSLWILPCQLFFLIFLGTPIISESMFSLSPPRLSPSFTSSNLPTFLCYILGYFFFKNTSSIVLYNCVSLLFSHTFLNFNNDMFYTRMFSLALFQICLIIFSSHLVFVHTISTWINVNISYIIFKILHLMILLVMLYAHKYILFCLCFLLHVMVGFLASRWSFAWCVDPQVEVVYFRKGTYEGLLSGSRGLIWLPLQRSGLKARDLGLYLCSWHRVWLCSALTPLGLDFSSLLMSL